jgi:CheY-like chemotaxis protein
MIIVTSPQPEPVKPPFAARTGRFGSDELDISEGEVAVVISRDGLPGAPLHVLVADDEPHIGRIIKMKLEQGPFQVTLAYDGKEALELLEQDSQVAVVLLDLMMPNLSGLDVLAKLRSEDRWRTLPCIILTAAGQEEQHVRAMELGATAFMTKPFSPKRLYAVTAELAGLKLEDASTESG